MNLAAFALGDFVDVGADGGDEAELVEHRGAQLASVIMNDAHGFFHQSAHRCDGAWVDRRRAGEDGETDIDADQDLADFIMQLMADFFALVFQREEVLMGHLAQLFLQLTRLQQQLLRKLLAFREGGLHGLTADDFLLQFRV